MFSGVHLSVLMLGPTKTLPCVAAIRRSGAQALERIDHERQRLEVDDDLFDRFRGELFAVGGEGENRLAFVDRFVGQRELRRHRRRRRRRRRGRAGSRCRGGGSATTTRSCGLRSRSAGRRVSLPDVQQFRRRHRSWRSGGRSGAARGGCARAAASGARRREADLPEAAAAPADPSRSGCRARRASRARRTHRCCESSRAAAGSASA